MESERDFRKYNAEWRERNKGLLVSRKQGMGYPPFGYPPPKRTWLQRLFRKPARPYEIEGLASHEECEEGVDELLGSGTFLGRIKLRVKKLWNRI